MIKKSLTIFSSTALEYFEFSIFLFYSFVIAKNYFNNVTYSIPILLVLITSLGKLFGGTLIASFIDKIGSIKIYKFTMALTAICTLLILVLPDYNKIGIFSGFIFILIRFVQVASASAEAASSVILARENFENKAYASAIVSSAFIFGCGIANLVSNLVSIDLFKYVIVSSSVVLFLFRFYLVKGGLKDRFSIEKNIIESKYISVGYQINSMEKIDKNTIKIKSSTPYSISIVNKENESNPFKLSHFYDVLKVVFIMTPALMLQFNLFNFKSKDNAFNMTLMASYVIIAILFSLINSKKYFLRFGFGYLSVFILSITAIIFKLNDDLFKLMMILPFGALLSPLFAVILDKIDSKKSGLILTLGAAIANTITVFVLQNVSNYYIYCVSIFALLGFLVVLGIDKNDTYYKERQSST